VIYPTSQEKLRNPPLRENALEGKRGILETGLHGLKSLLKRRTVVNLSKEDQVETLG
jgi:hypothetical protein